MQTASQLQELQKWMAYVQYGQFQMQVNQQCQIFLQTFTTMRIFCERFTLPGEPVGNFLVFKGPIQTQAGNFPLKIILPSSYPNKPPLVYLDMQFSPQQIQAIPYINNQNCQVETSYHKAWNNSLNIVQVVQAVQGLIARQPPVAQQQMMMGQMQGAWGQQQQMQQPQMQQQQQFAGQYQQPGMMQQQQQMQQPSSGPQQLESEFMTLNDKYFEEVKKGVNALVDTKVAVHKHDKVLDDQIDDFKQRLGTIESNIETLQQDNDRMQEMVGEGQNLGTIDQNNIDDHVMPNNVLSEKLLNYHCKTASLEDAMNVVKKAYEKDKIDLKEYLNHVRTLSKKQCKTMIKVRKLMTATQPQMPAAGQPQMHGQQPMPGMMQQPGMQPGMMQPQPGMQPGMMQPGMQGQMGMQGMMGMQQMQPGMGRQF